MTHTEWILLALIVIEVITALTWRTRMADVEGDIRDLKSNSNKMREAHLLSLEVMKSVVEKVDAESDPSGSEAGK